MSTYRDIHCVDLAPLRGAIRFIIGSGGLRGLRPPATFFATLRVALRSVIYINAFGRGPGEGLSARVGPHTLPQSKVFVANTRPSSPALLPKGEGRSIKNFIQTDLPQSH